MKLDLDALEREATCVGDIAAIVGHDELAALVRIARAAVAWRDARPTQGVHAPHKVWTVDEAPIVTALYEAGL